MHLAHADDGLLPEPHGRGGRRRRDARSAAAARTRWRRVPRGARATRGADRRDAPPRISAAPARATSKSSLRDVAASIALQDGAVAPLVQVVLPRRVAD